MISLNTLYVLCGLFSGLLLAYLVYALLCAEDF